MIVKLRPPAAATKEGVTDANIIREIASWRIQRARLMMLFAKVDRANLFGVTDDEDPEADFSPGAEWTDYELRQNFIAEIVPRNVLTARELLRVCVEILAFSYADPESRFGEGPILQIVRNVLDALDYMPPECVFGKEVLVDAG